MKISRAIFNKCKNWSGRMEGSSAKLKKIVKVLSWTISTLLLLIEAPSCILFNSEFQENDGDKISMDGV